MSNQTTSTVQVPYRLGFMNGTYGANVKFGVKGSSGISGDAGWTIASFPTRDAAVEFMKTHGAARMPCWATFEC